MALGMIPAVALRFAILRKPISRLAAAITCFAILIYVAILVSTSVEKQFRRPDDEPLMGPLPILTKEDYDSFKRYAYVTRTSLGERTGEILVEEALRFVATSPGPGN